MKEGKIKKIIHNTWLILKDQISPLLQDQLQLSNNGILNLIKKVLAN